MEALSFEMAVEESRPFRFSFERREEIAADALDTVSIAVSPASGLTVGTPTLSGDEVLVRLTAVTVGEYRLTVKVQTTTNDYINVGHVDVSVTAPE